MKCMSGIHIVLLGNAARVGHAEERSISTRPFIFVGLNVNAEMLRSSA